MLRLAFVPVPLPLHPRHHLGRILALAALFALLALLLLPSTGCRPVDGRAAAAAAAGDDPAAAPAAAAVRPAPDAPSLDDLAGQWRDQDGRARTLASTAAPVRVVAMVYASCTHTCPLLVADLKRLDAALPAAARDGVRYVLVSLDPARDTPERLREFATNLRLDPARWTVLAGGDDEVRELAAALDVRFRRAPDGEIDHSNVLTVLDHRGAVALRQPGVGGDVAPLAATVAALLAP